MFCIGAPKKNKRDKLAKEYLEEGDEAKEKKEKEEKHFSNDKLNIPKKRQPSNRKESMQSFDESKVIPS